MVISRSHYPNRPFPLTYIYMKLLKSLQNFKKKNCQSACKESILRVHCPYRYNTVDLLARPIMIHRSYSDNLKSNIKANNFELVLNPDHCTH